MDIRSTARFFAGVTISLTIVVLVTLIWLGVTAPIAANPLFYFGLIFLGVGALSLLYVGVGVAVAGARARTTPELDLRFFQSIRRLALVGWLCAIVNDALGVLVVLAIADGRGGTALSTGTVTVAFAMAALTVVWAGITSVVMRRVLPSR